MLRPSSKRISLDCYWKTLSLNHPCLIQILLKIRLRECYKIRLTSAVSRMISLELGGSGKGARVAFRVPSMNSFWSLTTLVRWSVSGVTATNTEMGSEGTRWAWKKQDGHSLMRCNEINLTRFLQKWTVLSKWLNLQ